MTRLALDFESYSELDIKKVGSSRYTRHASTRALLLGWAIDDDEVEVVRFAEGEKAPKILKEALRDPDVIKTAWNASFERQLLANHFGLSVPFDQWRDTMVLSLGLSFPGKLEKAGPIIGIDEDKQKHARGKALIKKFCGPRKPTKKDPSPYHSHRTHPEEWEEFVEYCANDVIAERAIAQKLKRWDLPESEWALWHLDQEINEAGIPINMRVVKNAISVYEDILSSRLARMREVTGLANPNSNSQLLPWLQEQGYVFEDLKAGHIKTAVSRIEESQREDENPELFEVLKLRQEVSQTSVKKYASLLAHTDEDGLLRNTLQFNGAPRTNRWAGRTFQPQNLKKPPAYLEKMQTEMIRDLEFLDAKTIECIYEKPMDVLASCVRPVVQARDGFLLVDADLNAIENRVLGWLADDQKILDVFRHGRDPYIDFAKYMTGRTYEDLWHEYKVEENKSNRTLAKPATLGCGYMLGAGEEKENKKTGEMEATGLLGYAANMGVKMTQQQATRAVKVFRNTYTDVVDFWDDLDKAMRKCIRTRQPTRVGFITFDISGPFLRMGLPNGTYLHYYRPSIKMKKTPWGEVRPTICYWGLNDKKHWTELTTHPGKITENAVQKVARDVLAHGLKLAKRKGLDTRLHVHDQVITMEPSRRAAESLEILRDSMAKVPKWAPGLILAAEGTTSHAFFKD